MLIDIQHANVHCNLQVRLKIFLESMKIIWMIFKNEIYLKTLDKLNGKMHSDVLPLLK
jgi:hypothetical protein